MCGCTASVVQLLRCMAAQIGSYGRTCSGDTPLPAQQGCVAAAAFDRLILHKRQFSQTQRAHTMLMQLLHASTFSSVDTRVLPAAALFSLPCLLVICR